MDPELGILISGGLSMLILEAIKWFIKVIGKKPDFGFPVSFYAIALPVLNALVPFALVWLGFPSDAPVLELSLLGVVKYLIAIALGSVISLGAYKVSIQPMKEKAEEDKLLKG